MALSVGKDEDRKFRKVKTDQDRAVTMPTLAQRAFMTIWAVRCQPDRPQRRMPRPLRLPEDGGQETLIAADRGEANDLGVSAVVQTALETAAPKVAYEGGPSTSDPRVNHLAIKRLCSGHSRLRAGQSARPQPGGAARSNWTPWKLSLYPGCYPNRSGDRRARGTGAK